MARFSAKEQAAYHKGFTAGYRKALIDFGDKRKVKRFVRKNR